MEIKKTATGKKIRFRGKCSLEQVELPNTDIDR